jgi:hypothetical protein
MFSFFFKRSTVTLDCFTNLPYVYDFAKIDKAVKFIPDWWKNTPRTVEGKEHGTIKNCPGFIDYYATGIVMPSWFETNITIHSKNDPEERWYSFQSSNNDFDVSKSHAPYQFENFAGFDGKNIKIETPWVLKTKQKVDFLVTQPTWNHRDMLTHFSVLPAVVNYKYQHFTNINMFVINKDEERVLNIPPLMPMIMLHPLTDKKVEIKTHLVDDREWNRLTGVYNLIIRDDEGYKKKKEIYKKVSKCPFHRG